MSEQIMRVLDDVSTVLPWELVEVYSTMPRWEPKDVNRSADEIVSRLAAHDVPVTVHEPELYLSIPFSAEIRTADGADEATSSFGMSVDDVVLSWREFTLEEDQHECGTSGA